MIDTRDKRAAALGFGLAFLLVLPVADGAIAIEDAAHVLGRYRYDIEAQARGENIFDGDSYTGNIGTVGVDSTLSTMCDGDSVRQGDQV